MNELTHTPETQTPEEPEQNGEDCPDPTRLSEVEYATLRDWLETHYPALKLSKKLSSLLSQGDKEAALKDCQAPLRDWLWEICANIQAPSQDCTTLVQEWLLKTPVDIEFEQIGERSGDPETQPPHYFKDMLLRLIRSLEFDMKRRYEREYDGSLPSPVKYMCNKCRQDLWLREKDPWVCYWCQHEVLLKVKG